MTAPDRTSDLRARAERVRSEMGGVEKVAKMSDEGDRTIRQHIDSFLDDDSFREIGTFSRSLRVEEREKTPGDGKIGGHGTVDSRPVAVFGDDITVYRGSSSIVGTRKEHRLYERAMAMGIPIVHFGETGGARIPDTMGAEGISEPGGLFELAKRRHRVPMATMVTGQSFGGSSFLSALSDYVVMVRGSCLAVTSPKVFEIATGEVISFEDVGGVDVHARKTGQIDLGVESDQEGYDAIRKWLAYLPSNAWEIAPRNETRGSLDHDPGLAELVPAKRTRGYDMRRVVERIVDTDSLLEIQPLYARNVVCGMARLNGFSVGVIANNPMFGAGTLDPQACHKIIRLATVCDSYNIPIIFLADVPGFMVGERVEHELMLHWGMRMMHALQNCSAPTLTVCIRKAFGLAWQAMNGSQMPALGCTAGRELKLGSWIPRLG